jgi:predicted RNA-binding protein with RPS1 domain
MCYCNPNPTLSLSFTLTHSLTFSHSISLSLPLLKSRALQATGGGGLTEELESDAATEVTTASTFGVLLESILAQLSSVLSSNPFELDLSKAAAILAFTGCLVGFILLTLFFLIKLDYNERIQKIYVKKEQLALAAKLLQEDMKGGGKGDLGESFNKYIHKLNDRNTVVGKVKRLSVSIRDQGSLLWKDESASKTNPHSRKESRRNSLPASFKTQDASFRRKSDARTMYENWTGKATTPDFVSSKSEGLSC